MSRISGHIRHNVIGYLALLIALSGTAYAANKIGSKDIKPGAVKSKQAGNNALKSKDIKDGNLRAKDIDESTLPSSIRLNLPPTSWVSAGVPDADVRYAIGTAIVEQGGGAGSRGVHADVQVPNRLGAGRFSLQSFELCYDAGASATLSEISVRTIESTSSVPFSDTTVISDETNRTDSTCRKYQPAEKAVLGPNEFVEPSVAITFAGGEFRIYRTTLVFKAA